MRILFTAFLFVLGVSLCQAQTRTGNQNGTKENPVEKTVAKTQVKVELQKNLDSEGNINYNVKETRIEIPVSFPKYIDTGDPKHDEENYYQAKQLWIKEHPEEFEKIKHLNL